MIARGEMLALACHQDDPGVLREACQTQGSALRVLDRPVEVAQRLVSRPPLAVFLGLGEATQEHLELIPVIRAGRDRVPVIVIAEEDSLDLEGKARQKDIFYYLVHPIEPAEVEAVLKDVLRHWQG